MPGKIMRCVVMCRVEEHVSERDFCNVVQRALQDGLPDIPERGVMGSFAKVLHYSAVLGAEKVKWRRTSSRFRRWLVGFGMEG